ncbi:MAG: hypothetical protein AAF907_09705 [Planctomycetota bacterium]
MFGWPGVAFVAGGACVALFESAVSPEHKLRPAPEPSAADHTTRYEPDAQASAVGTQLESADQPPELALRAQIGDRFEEEAELQPDQWFRRTDDAAEGELLVRCEHGVGTAHLLFWPAFSTPPRVECHAADGLGRVRAAHVLPQGVRFEVTRPDGETGLIRIGYEAAA